MSGSYSRLAAIRDYWMPRDPDARAEVRVTDIDEILRELVRVVKQRDALLERADTLQRWYDQQLDRLAAVEAQRDALLEALCELLADAEFLGWDTAKARAAIKAVEGEKE